MNIREEYLHLMRQRGENILRIITDVQKELDILFKMIDKFGTLEESDRRSPTLNPIEQLVKEYADNDLLTCKETSKILGVSLATLSTWRCSGLREISFIKIGGAVRYRFSDIQKFIENGKKMHTTDIRPSRFAKEHKFYSGTKSS